MHKDGIAPELEVLRDVACLRLEDIIMGLMAFGLDRSASMAILEDAIDQAVEETYGTETIPRRIGIKEG